MPYNILYFNDTVHSDILELPPTLLAKYIVLTRRMEVVGSHLGEPHTKAFGQGLFELRLKGAEGIARVFFCTMIDQQIIILHSFIKKSQKTPTKELNIAKARLEELKQTAKWEGLNHETIQQNPWRASHTSDD